MNGNLETVRSPSPNTIKGLYLFNLSGFSCDCQRALLLGVVRGDLVTLLRDSGRRLRRRRRRLLFFGFARIALLLKRERRECHFNQPYGDI